MNIKNWRKLSDDGLAPEKVAADKAAPLTEAAKALVWAAMSLFILYAICAAYLLVPLPFSYFLCLPR